MILGAKGLSKSATTISISPSPQVDNLLAAAFNLSEFLAVKTKSNPLTARHLAISNPIPEEAP